MSDDQDWRLQLELEEPADLDALVHRTRGGGGDLDHDVRAALSDDTVLTHDGSVFFAYTRSRGPLDDARQRIEEVLHQDARRGTIRISHWDDDLHAWLQIDPPLTEAEEERARGLVEEHLRRANEEANVQETRTVGCVIGKLVRKSFEEQALKAAQELGLECVIVEHPHLLSTQVAFRVTGARENIEQFVGYEDIQARAGSRMDLGLVT